MMNEQETSENLPRVAIIGCGAWGKNLVRNFAELQTLVAVCDHNSHKAEKISRQHKTQSMSEEKILKDPSIDAVVIASSAFHHADQAKKALKAGKHVYIEKPMALSTQAAKDLCELAKHQNRVLMIGHILNYHPAFIELKKRLSELGPLRHIYANRLGLGRFRHQESVLWDLACHDISLILALAQEKPKTVKASGHAYLTPEIPADALLSLEFSQGLTAHIHASWISPFKEQKLVVIGEKAIAVFDDRKPWSEKLTILKDYSTFQENQPVANTSCKSHSLNLPESEPLKNECLHFLTCIQKGETPLTSGSEGLRVTEVLETAENSLKRKASQ